MPNLESQLATELELWAKAGLLRTRREVTSAQGARITMDGREYVNFSSNDYLGLANDPLLKRAATDGLARYGVGSGASRLVCGNLEPYRLVEEKLAAFKKKEAALVFGSGYAANVGIISALVGRGDVVILDKLDHASIIDGARQSEAKIRVFPHKNLKKLEQLLVSSREESNAGRVLVVTETVFSMDGDRAPLREIVRLKEKYGAWLMIDEAHATGVLGANRRGLAEAEGVEQGIDVTLGTLSKALGCAGGYVAGSRTLIDFLWNKARSLVYSTALPPSVVSATAAAVDFVASQEGAKRCARLWENVRLMQQGLVRLGIKVAAESPILPLIIGDEQEAVAVSRRLQERGVFVPAIRYPTVPRGKARLRVTVTAAHSPDDINRFLEAMETIGVGTKA
jgi:glycine C-acetyltransferase/8-amino-7-oxononanoate synthase